MAAAAPSATPSTPGKGLPLFTKTLLVSLLIHVSAITLFSVVIYFPKGSVRYLRVALREDAAERVTVASAAGEDNPLLKRMTTPRVAVPEVLVPVLDPDDGAAAPERLRVGRSYFEPAPAPTEDTWMQFGKGIQQVRTLLVGGTGARLRLEAPESAPADAGPTIELGGDLEAKIDWNGDAPRELVMQPTALFVNPRPERPAEYLLNVSPAGAVVNVINVNPAPTPFEREFAEYLKQCRFEAAPDKLRDTSVTLTVRRGGETP